MFQNRGDADCRGCDEFIKTGRVVVNARIVTALVHQRASWLPRSTASQRKAGLRRVSAVGSMMHVDSFWSS